MLGCINGVRALGSSYSPDSREGGIMGVVIAVVALLSLVAAGASISCKDDFFLFFIF